MHHGYKVVLCAFLVAVFAWGLGFYGVGVFVQMVQATHGWSAATVSSAVTLYYALGAGLIAFVAIPFERFGSRTVVLTGAAALAAGSLWLANLAALWQLYAAFALMAMGWACMSGAALNLIVAPWFERNRGLAISIAFNGASVGGIVVVPALIFFIVHYGSATGVLLICVAMAAVLVPAVLRWLHRSPASIGLGPDGVPLATPECHGPAAAPVVRTAVSIRSWHFASLSLPFALGLMAQVGVLTHQVSFLRPVLGAAGAGWAVSLTTAAAISGRLIVGLFVDRVNRRLVAGGNFLMQACALGVLAFGSGPAVLYLGCLVFGLGVGNMTSLPSLIVQVEFPKAAFGRLVGAAIAINQFTYAFGPTLVGWLKDRTGGYPAGLLACAGLLVLACCVIVGGRALVQTAPPAASPVPQSA
jgi:MFS family permease